MSYRCDPHDKAGRMSNLPNGVLDRALRVELSPAGTCAFLRISDAWGLAAEEQRVILGSPSRSTFRRWSTSPERLVLRADTLERISYVLGIFKALQVLFPEPERADAWIRRRVEAPPLNGQSALQRMLAGRVVDLADVRRYLDSLRN